MTFPIVLGLKNSDFEVPTEKRSLQCCSTTFPWAVVRSPIRVCFANLRSKFDGNFLPTEQIRLSVTKKLNPQPKTQLFKLLLFPSRNVICSPNWLNTGLGPQKTTFNSRNELRVAKSSAQTLLVKFFLLAELNLRTK